MIFLINHLGDYNQSSKFGFIDFYFSSWAFVLFIWFSSLFCFFQVLRHRSWRTTKQGLNIEGVCGVHQKIKKWSAQETIDGGKTQTARCAKQKAAAKNPGKNMHFFTYVFGRYFRVVNSDRKESWPFICNHYLSNAIFRVTINQHGKFWCLRQALPYRNEAHPKSCNLRQIVKQMMQGNPWLQAIWQGFTRKFAKIYM